MINANRELQFVQRAIPDQNAAFPTSLPAPTPEAATVKLSWAFFQQLHANENLATSEHPLTTATERLCVKIVDQLAWQVFSFCCQVHMQILLAS